METLLTKHQIENDVTIGFVHGVFVATAIACIEDDHVSERPNIVERREVLYKTLGGVTGFNCRTDLSHGIRLEIHADRSAYGR